jgi:hypothetical protein
MASPFGMIEVAKEIPTRPRGRACLVVTEEYFGQKEWGARLAELTSMQHVDLLDEFSTDPTLAQSVSSFSVTKLFEHLRQKNQSPLLIVTSLEFLRATWIGNAIEQFAQQIETWDKTPALLIVIQYSDVLAKRKFTRFPDKTFVIEQKNTLKLQ